MWWGWAPDSPIRLKLHFIIYHLFCIAISWLSIGIGGHILSDPIVKLHLINLFSSEVLSMKWVWNSIFRRRILSGLRDIWDVRIPVTAP